MVQFYFNNSLARRGILAVGRKPEDPEKTHEVGDNC